MTAELAPRLLRFIHQCIPTYQAAEVILFFAANPDRGYTAEEVVAAMRPAIVTVPAVREYAALFTAAGVVTDEDGRLTCRPATPDVEAALGDLADAYNERPVTLIAAIYRIADSRIQSFADAFKLRKGDS